MNENKWSFDDPQDTAVFTVRLIWEKRKPILFVYHDEEDGAWQFHTNREPKEEEASIISLSEIVALDLSISELADLPSGWFAWRSSVSKPWNRQLMK